MSERLDQNKVRAALDEAAEAATTGSKLERAGRFIWVRAHEQLRNGNRVRVMSHKRPRPSTKKN